MATSHFLLTPPRFQYRLWQTEKTPRNFLRGVASSSDGRRGYSKSPMRTKSTRYRSKASFSTRTDLPSSATVTIASSAGCRVVFELPDAVEKEGFSVVTKARLDGNKLKMLGWQPDYDIQRGISRLMMILCH